MIDLNEIKKTIDLAEHLESLMSNYKATNVLLDATNLLVKTAVTKAITERYGEVAATRMSKMSNRSAYEALTLFEQAVQARGIKTVRGMVCTLRAYHSHGDHVEVLKVFGMTAPESRTKTQVSAIARGIIILLEDGKKESL